MIDKDKLTTSLTAFIDVLGSRQKVLDAKSDEDLSNIVKNLKIIQDAFEYGAVNKLTLDVQQLYNKTVLAFSDCVIVNMPLESEGGQAIGTFDLILTAISDIAIGQGLCCTQSLFVRGGIDLGWWYRDDSLLVSKGLTNAYLTETQASIPVIAVTEKLYHYLSSHETRKQYHPSIDPIRALFRVHTYYKKNVYYIDYITASVDIVGPDQRRIDSWLIGHARNIENAYKFATSKKVMKKYSWLSKYHNEIAKQYSENRKSRCRLQRAATGHK